MRLVHTWSSVYKALAIGGDMRGRAVSIYCRLSCEIILGTVIVIVRKYSFIGGLRFSCISCFRGTRRRPALSRSGTAVVEA